MYTIDPSASPKHACMQDLQMRILSLDLEPGSDLDEATLTSHYGISRTPLREILQRLGGDGFLQLQDNKGAKVASLDWQTLRTFFQTAPLIYANVSRLAAENRRTEQLDRLKEVQLKFAKATRDGDAAESVLLNHAFHAVVGEMAQNPYLVAGLNRMLIDHTRLSQTFYRPQNTREEGLVTKACDQHDAMISAIAGQEPALAVDLTLQHWDLSKDQIERFVRPDPLPLDVASLKDHAHAI